MKSPATKSEHQSLLDEYRRRRWRDPALSLLKWGGLFQLFYATYGVISFASRHIGIDVRGRLLTLGKDIYHVTRDAFFFPVDVVTGLGNFAIPGGLKDLSFVYLYIGGAVVWTLQSLYSGRGSSLSIFGLLRRRAWRQLIALNMARLLWPIHLFGFWLNWLDPKRVYFQVQPALFEIIEASGFYDFTDNFVPPLVVYTIAVAITASLVILASVWLV